MEQVRLGQLTLQPRRQLLASGERVPLGRRGLEILSVLAEAGGELVTKDELMAAVWPNAIVEENAMQAQISALRKALGPEADRLRTVHGIGYQLDLLPGSVPTSAVTETAKVSIIVLPFDNMSADPEQEYFADGISEDVITDLSKVSALKVIARNSAFTLKGQSVDVTEVARRFGVTHVLEGSVRKAGQRLRITAQLIDGRDGSHVWADRYDRDLADIFELQDEVVKTIVANLEVKLHPTESEAIADRGTDNLEAYDLLLRSRSLLLQFGTEFVERSVELARAAIDIDPGFVLAYRQLAAALDQLVFLMPEKRGEIGREREEVIAKVAEIAPGDPLFTLMRVRQLVVEGRLLEAEELNKTVPPGFAAPTFWAAPEFFDFYVGHFRDVLQLAREGVERDPMDRMASLALHDLLDINGLPEETDAENERNKDLPGDRVHYELAHFMRGKGRATPEELAARYRTMMQSSPFVQTIPLFAQLEPVLEDAEAARELIRKAADDPSCQDPMRQMWIAMLAGHYDEKDVALTILRRVFGDPNHMVDLRCMMWQSPLIEVRRDPRFKDILYDLGLVDYWRATGRWGDIVRPVGEGDFEVIG